MKGLPHADESMIVYYQQHFATGFLHLVLGFFALSSAFALSFFSMLPLLFFLCFYVFVCLYILYEWR